MEYCKENLYTFDNQTVFDSYCCGCESPEWGCVTTPLPPIILEKVDLEVFDFNPSQYIIPLKIACHGKISCLDGANSCGNIQLLQKRPYSIRVIGSNPANVSFYWANGENFSRTNVWGMSYNQNLFGLCMVVDKDPSNVEIPKSSTIIIGIKRCITDVEYTQVINTDNFFNYNFFYFFC